MYPSGCNCLKTSSDRPMSLGSYSSYPASQSTYPRQPQPKNFTRSQIAKSNIRTPTSIRACKDTFGRVTQASVSAQSPRYSTYSPHDSGTSRFKTSIQNSADEYSDYSNKSSFTDDVIYGKEPEIITSRENYQFGSVAPRTQKTPKFPSRVAELRTPAPARIVNKYSQLKSQSLPSARLLMKFLSDRPCCAGHDTFSVHCTPELGLLTLTLRRSISDLFTSSLATTHAESYQKLFGDPPYCKYKNSKVSPAQKLATEVTTKTTCGTFSNHNDYLTTRKTAKSTSSTNVKPGNEPDKYGDSTTKIKNKVSAAVTPWYTRPITGSILQASPGLKTIEYATPRTSETPYGIARARNGHPIYCILDIGAAVITISPSILIRAFPGIKTIVHRKSS